MDQYEFYSDFLKEMISIIRTTDGFIASTTINSIHYVSKPVSDGILSTMSIDQFAELHKKFAYVVTMEDDKVLLDYRIGFLGLEFEFVMLKEVFIPETEKLDESKEHIDTIASLREEIEVLKNSMLSSAKPYIIRFWYTKKGVEIEIDEKIRIKFMNLMFTFLKCAIYTEDNRRGNSVDWQTEFINVEGMLAHINELYYIRANTIVYIDIFSAIEETIGRFPYSLYLKKIEEIPVFARNYHPYKILCDNLHVKKIQIVEIHMYALPEYNIYEDIICDKQHYNILHITPYKNIFGVYYNKLYQIQSNGMTIWHENAWKRVNVVWNTDD